MRNFLKKLANNNILFLVLIFFIGIFSYIGDILLFKSQLNSNIFMNSLALVAIYLYDKKIANIIYFLGTCTAFYIVKIYNFAPFLDLYVLLFSSLYLFFFGNIFKKIINTWELKKTINYFIYSTLLTGILSILYLFLLLYVYILLSKMNNPLLKKQSIFFIMKSIIQYQVGNNPLLFFSNLGFNNMILNINIFSASYFASILLFFINLKNNPSGSINSKLDFFNIPVSKKYKYVFSFVLLLTILSFYFLKVLFYLLITVCISLFFLFFIIGREIILNILYSITPNIIMINIILVILQSFVPILTFIFIAIGIVEVYCKLWNENREK